MKKLIFLTLFFMLNVNLNLRSETCVSVNNSFEACSGKKDLDSCVYTRLNTLNMQGVCKAALPGAKLECIRQTYTPCS